MLIATLVGRSAALPSRSVAQARAIPGERHLGVGLQRGRQRNPAIVVGRRSWLFADTVGGAKGSANLYSLIETARANNVEPYRHLVALFQKVPLAQIADDYEALLPWRLMQ